MKILLTTHLFLPEYFAGTEILAYSTAKELQLSGHDVQVLTAFPGHKELADADRFDRYEIDGITVTRFLHADVPMGNQRDVLTMEYDNRFVAEWFKEYLERVRPDVVHFFHLARLSASLIDVCQQAGIPMVFTPTDFWFICPLYQLRLPDNSQCSGPDRFSVNCLRHLDFLSRPAGERTAVRSLPDGALALCSRLARWGLLPRRRFSFVHAVCRRRDFLIARLNTVGRVIMPTHLMERILVKQGLEQGKIAFHRFGIDTHAIPHSVRSGQHAPLRVGFIGSLYEQKGILLLLKAFKSLPESFPAVLQVYGENRESPAFVAQLKAEAAADKRISFKGTFPNERIGDVFQDLDVLVVPSTWYENSPLVIYSAQAAGCPVIATNLGGMAEVVEHEVTGLLVPAGDIPGIAAAILRLGEDRQLLRRLSENARPPQSIGDYVNELLPIYTDLLEQSDKAQKL